MESEHGKLARVNVRAPLRLRLLPILSALVTGLGCAGNSPNADVPQRDEVPPNPPSSDATVATGPRVACSEDEDAPRETKPDPKKKAAAPQARKDLALLLPPKPAAAKPIAKTSALAKTTIHLPECVRPRAEIDLASLDVPADVPRAGLSADLYPDWDKLTAARKTLLDAQARVAKLERRRADCERERCAKRICLDTLFTAASAQAGTSKKDVVEREAELVKKLEAATPSGGAMLAIGLLRERAVKRGEGDPATEMKPVVASYEAAKAKATADTEIGWFARYRLALAYDDVNLAKQAKAEWSALAGAPPRPRGTAEVHFRVAEREPDPVKAAQSFERAIGALSPEEAPLRVAFTYRLLRAQTSAGRYADAAATAASLLDMARDADDPGIVTETIDELALALDAIGDGSTPLPSIPADEWNKVGAAVAREAFARFDPSSAAVAQKAMGTATGTTQSPADAAMRVNAVARACGFLAFGGEGGEVDVRVEAMTEGRAKVTARKTRGDAQLDAAVACIARRGPSYFVGAPSGASATVVFLPK